MTDGQTDRQTPRRWQRRAKHSAFARKNEVAKTKVICVKFLPGVARQKLLKSANVSRSYSKNKSDAFLWTTVYKILNKQVQNVTFCAAVAWTKTIEIVLESEEYLPRCSMIHTVVVKAIIQCTNNIHQPFKSTKTSLNYNHIKVTRLCIALNDNPSWRLSNGITQLPGTQNR